MNINNIEVIHRGWLGPRPLSNAALALYATYRMVYRRRPSLDPFPVPRLRSAPDAIRQVRGTDTDQSDTDTHGHAPSRANRKQGIRAEAELCALFDCTSPHREGGGSGAARSVGGEPTVRPDDAPLARARQRNPRVPPCPRTRARLSHEARRGGRGRGLRRSGPHKKRLAQRLARCRLAVGYLSGGGHGAL